MAAATLEPLTAPEAVVLTKASAPAVPVLRCEGLKKRFGDRQAVDGVGFVIGPGETYGLLGPNGAGKTTTISMICGILARDAGVVEVAGERLDVGTTHAKRLVGIVPQDLAIYPDLSARENLDYFGRFYGMRGEALRQRIDEVLDVVQLSDRQRERTAGYSGGMKRRLNIAIGLLHRPHLLVLDEPTVGVDPQSRNAILASVETLSDAGIGILYTTHYMEEAERLCDRIGIVDQGRIIAEGTRQELVRLVGESDRVSIATAGNVAAAAEALRAVPRVLEVSSREGGLDVIVPDAATMLPALLEAAGRTGATARSVEVVEPDLEAVFLHLTGKALRD